MSPVTPSVLIPEGSSTADIPLTTTTVAAQTTVTFTASLAGVNRQVALTVNAAAPTLQSAAFLASTVSGGQGATLRLTLSGNALSNTAVTLSSANTNVATIAGSVMVIYAAMLGSQMQGVLGQLITKSIMSVPAAILFAHVLLPTDNDSSQQLEKPPRVYDNF